MKFRVIDCCYEDASGVPANGADFLLEEDSWNDYGYYTLYHLHATHNITGNGNENVGYLRIMRIDQQEGSGTYYVNYIKLVFSNRCLIILFLYHQV